MLLNVLAVGDVVGEGPGHSGPPPAGGQTGGGHPLYRGQWGERLRRGPHPRQARGCMMPGPTSSPWATTPGTASRSPTFWTRTLYPPPSQLRLRPGAGPGLRRIRRARRPADRCDEPDGAAGAELQFGQPLQDRQPAAAGAEAQRCDLVLVDFHAEATSEKGRWPGIWTGGSRPLWGPTPMCPRRTGRSCPRGRASSPTWA